MVEYMVLSNGHKAFQDVDDLEIELNRLAQEDWVVVCHCPRGLILERLLPNEADVQAAEIVSRSASYSWPVEVCGEL